MKASNPVPSPLVASTSHGNGGTGSRRSSVKFSEAKSDQSEQRPPQPPARSAKQIAGSSFEGNLPPLSTNTFERLWQSPESESVKMFTTREEELQRLLADERQRSEKRRQNYATLKDEHLRVQKEYLNLQTEVKQMIEETNYFKEKKNEEIENLLTQMEARKKAIEKLQEKLKELEPEVLRNKLAEEFEEPQRRLQRDKDRLEREKESVVYEVKLLRQQIDHLEKEHLDSIERVRLSYEAEVNLVKREKEEIRTRLVEASQSPDVAKLLALSEENARLARRLQAAQASLETAEEQYRAIQKRVEDFVIEHDQKERTYRNEIEALREKITMLKKEINNCRSESAAKNQEVDELLAEIGVLKRLRESTKVEAAVATNRAVEDLQELKRRYDKQAKLEAESKAELIEEIKKLKIEIETKNESIDTLEKLVATKVRELNQKAEEVRGEEMDKLAKLTHEKKQLEAKVVSLESQVHSSEAEMKSIRKDMEKWSHDKLVIEREKMLLKVKVETQAKTIEELEKIKRQHVMLHEETTRLRSEFYDLQANNRELARLQQIARDEVSKAKETADNERRHREELIISHEKAISRLSRRFDEERTELIEKITTLDRENNRVRMNEVIVGTTRPITVNAYSRLKARQYSNMADQLNSVLDRLKVDDKAKAIAKTGQQTAATNGKTLGRPMRAESISARIASEQVRQHDTVRRELETIKVRQAELEKMLTKTR